LMEEGKLIKKIYCFRFVSNTFESFAMWKFEESFLKRLERNLSFISWRGEARKKSIVIEQIENWNLKLDAWRDFGCSVNWTAIENVRKPTMNR
jgi:hypothetical protein